MGTSTYGNCTTYLPEQTRAVISIVSLTGQSMLTNLSSSYGVDWMVNQTIGTWVRNQTSFFKFYILIKSKSRTLDPPQEHHYINAKTLLIVTPAGKILQLFTPIRAICKTAVPGIQAGTTVFIEAVMMHKEHKMCYQITGIWYLYRCFIISK